mmetsp:Transcript_30517/g.86293  ORF Transcript_30517/g.86293 Transcript_30517/m.86293 type:complete len:222 (+) Transcript_30517:485-1150(+)
MISSLTVATRLSGRSGRRRSLDPWPGPGGDARPPEEDTMAARRRRVRKRKKVRRRVRRGRTDRRTGARLLLPGCRTWITCGARWLETASLRATATCPLTATAAMKRGPLGGALASIRRRTKKKRMIVEREAAVTPQELRRKRRRRRKKTRRRPQALAGPPRKAARRSTSRRLAASSSATFRSRQRRRTSRICLPPTASCRRYISCWTGRSAPPGEWPTCPS